MAEARAHEVVAPTAEAAWRAFDGDGLGFRKAITAVPRHRDTRRAEAAEIDRHLSGPEINATHPPIDDAARQSACLEKTPTRAATGYPARQSLRCSTCVRRGDGPFGATSAAIYEIAWRQSGSEFAA